MNSKSKIQKFEDLIVWQKALSVSKVIFTLTGKTPLSREYALKDQLQRSSLSIISNIAEGFGRHSKPDFRHFLSIANGSANELRAQIHLIKELEYLDPSHADELIGLCVDISKMTKALRNSIKTCN